MKTFFKRTAAAATGTVLALTQLAAAAMINVNAAETRKWDKAWLINVPVEDTLKSEAIISGGEVVELTAPVTAGESKWNNEFETGILAIAGEAGANTTVATAAAKKAVKTALQKSGYADAELAEKIASAVSANANVTIDDGETVAVIEVAECGKDFGEVIENMMRETGCSFKNDLGGDIEIDWSSFKVSGKITVTATYTYDKNISYKVTFTDELGKTYSADQIFEYASRKKDEAAAVVQASAAKIAATYGIHDFTLEMGEFNDYAEKTINRAKNGIKKAYSVSLTGTDLDQTYADYLAAEKAVFAGSRVANAIDNRAPKSVTAALNNSRAAKGIDKLIDSLKSVAGEKVQIDISAADITDIVTSGYNYNITIPNGASADMTFSIADDQNAELLTALQTIDPTVVSVTSHKEITVNVDNKTDGTGNAYFNVVRVVDAIKKQAETTTSSTETTTTTTETTTTTDTTSSSKSTETTTTTSSTSSTETTTTSSSSKSTETTTTTNTTSSSKSTDSTTTTTQTTTSETTTSISYSVEYRANGADLGQKVYWSEETVDFNLDGLKVFLNIYANGEIEETFNVTNAFAPAAKNASELEFIGFGHYEIPVVLTDADAIKAAVEDEGFVIDELGTDAIVNDIKALGAPDVVLVLRGDINLDNKIDVKDAQAALIFYAEMRIGNTVEDVINHTTLSEDLSLLPYEHYAADVFDGNGKISVQDAQNILRYYGDHRIGNEVSWDDLAGHEVVVPAALHTDPLANDADAAAALVQE